MSGRRWALVAALGLAGVGLWILALPVAGAGLIGIATGVALARVLRPEGPMPSLRPAPASAGRSENAAAIASLLEALPDAAILLDRNARILTLNGLALQAFPALRQGAPLSLALRDPQVLASVQASLSDGIARAVELAERVPVERVFACTAARLGQAGRAGAGVRGLVLLRDVSREKAVETMRVDFIANASHELRTPLASILGFAETLMGPASDDAAARARFLPIMAEQARRMARLVDDLLSLSRIEMRQHQLPKDRVGLDGVVEQTVTTLAGLAADRGVVLRHTPPAEAVTVAGDRDELLRLFDNLVENAIKYGHAGKAVDIAYSLDAREVAVHIRDYGPGIDPLHLPRLTERFYRIDNALSRAEGGTGLGLALVKHILQRHRGRLGIASTPGKGACFSVTLPRLGTAGERQS